MSYKTAFPNFPFELIIPPDFEDTSTNEDDCPSFRTKLDARTSIYICVKNEPVGGTYPPFWVMQHTDDTGYDPLDMFDTFEQAIAYVRGYKDKCRAAHSLYYALMDRYPTLEVLETGGGCKALAGKTRDGFIVMTTKCGSYLPECDDLLVGFYKNEDSFIDGDEARLFLEV